MLVRTSNAEPAHSYYLVPSISMAAAGLISCRRIVTRTPFEAAVKTRRTASGRTGRLRIPSICTAYHGNIMWVAPEERVTDARGPGGYCITQTRDVPAHPASGMNPSVDSADTVGDLMI